MPQATTVVYKVYDMTHHRMGERLPTPTVVKVNIMEILSGLFPRNLIQLQSSAN